MIVCTSTETVIFDDAAVRAAEERDPSLAEATLLNDVGAVSNDEYAARIKAALEQAR